MTLDGYLYTYNQFHCPDVRWTNLQIEHELYAHGHLIEAAVSHYEATGRRDLLDIGKKAVDLLVREFLGAGPERTPGHQEIELALVRLYRVTGQENYIELAVHFLEQRGRTGLFARHILRQNQSVGRRGKWVEGQRARIISAASGYCAGARRKVRHSLPFPTPIGPTVAHPR